MHQTHSRFSAKIFCKVACEWVDWCTRLDAFGYRSNSGPTDYNCIAKFHNVLQVTQYITADKERTGIYVVATLYSMYIIYLIDMEMERVTE